MRDNNRLWLSTGYVAIFVDLKYPYDGTGKVIRPNAIGNGPDIIGHKSVANDPSRVRTDGLGMLDFGHPVAIAE